MNFSVGYQLLDDLSLVNAIIENKDKITEVYFSFGDFPNGRNDQKRCSFATREEAEERQIADLKRISESGISLNILFNATCYGADALSRSFFERIGNTVDGLSENLNIRSVTTTSPIIAKFIKSNFEGLKTRASVNMEIGSELGAEYLFDAFDGFYLKRELNRDIAAVKRLKKFYSVAEAAWVFKNGVFKRLFFGFVRRIGPRLRAESAEAETIRKQAEAQKQP